VGCLLEGLTTVKNEGQSRPAGCSTPDGSWPSGWPSIGKRKRIKRYFWHVRVKK
jgi:hypothetical protein